MTSLQMVRMGRQSVPPGPRPDALAAELSALRAQAHSEGHAQGLSRGHAEGLREGRQQGLALGQAEGRAQAQREAREHMRQAQQAQAAALHEARELWSRAAAQLQAVARSVHQGCTQELQLMCTELLIRLLGERLADPASIRARLGQLLDQLPPREPVTVRVHPSWLEPGAGLLAAPVQGGGPDPVGAAMDLRFSPDPTLGLADLVLDLPMGSVDARLDRVWDQVRAALHPVGAAADQGAA